MAETVKKSRIVSEAEENLEESLLEEFNLRLKKCMSRDDLQAELEDDTNNSETHVYENIEIIKANGAAPISNHHRNGNSSQEFLETEREHYDINKITSNGHQENGKSSDVEEENLELETCSVEKFDCESTKTDSNVDQNLGEVRPELNLQKPSLNLPTTCLIDTSESFETDNPDGKSVKDRMFLSTDDASCLLFTQTVTSPMLTPSEENIDFLKGFRRESSQYTLSDNTNSSNSPKSEPKVDKESNESNITTEIIENVVVTEKPKEIIYENTEFLKEHLHDLGDKTENVDNQNLNQNLEIPLKEIIVENLQQPQTEVVEETMNLKEETSKFIETEISFTEQTQSFEVENQEVVTDLDLVQETVPENHDELNLIPDVNTVIEEMSEVHTESVKILKSHFMKTESTEPLKSPRLETSDELDELKSLNIMKQISKFENTTNKTEEITNVCSNISVSTVTESRFVETTTETHASGDINLKKKKSKKSKNQHEKENISVNDTNINEEESFYNVNVKNLCRSFGDLTKIEGEQYRNWKNNERS